MPRDHSPITAECLLTALQMVVVGDQSAGKSSVLESLTGFQFPRSATLCTRHATEIQCRREPTESVVVSIIPHDPSPEREKLVREFRRSTDRITSDEFPKIFEDVSNIYADLPSS